MSKERDWENWDEAGVAQTIESYWAGSAHEKAHRETLADLCTLYIPSPDLDVLEVGCGTGRVYEQLVPRLIPNERYTGVDVSGKMLEIGRRKFPQARFLLGDGYGLQFPDRSFDVTLSFEVLGHVPEIGSFLHELIRVTRRTAVFTVWPAAHGVDEDRHVLNGQSFLYREYSHAYVYQQILEAAPDARLEMEVGVISAGCWAYVLHRRDEAGAGLHFSRLFPVYGYQQRLVAALTAAPD